MIFIPKPVVFIPYDEIEKLEISRGLSRARSFDIAVHLVGKQVIKFVQIEIEHKDELKRFLHDAGVRLDDTDEMKKTQSRDSFSSRSVPTAFSASAGPHQQQPPSGRPAQKKPAKRAAED